MTNKEMFATIYDKYRKEMFIRFEDLKPDESGYSYVSCRRVVLPKKAAVNPSGWDVLTLLHEIGHIKTNTNKMRVFEKEYLATQWSADEAKRLGFHIEETWKRIYQDYVFDKWKMCINKGGKNIPPKEKLMIKW